MRVIIDLSGLKIKEDVLRKFGEVFEFGGPNGNVPVNNAERKGWGINFDALTDSMRSLEERGIWGTSKTFAFPLQIVISNYEEFRNRDSEAFGRLQHVLKQQTEEYAKKGRHLEVQFV